MASRIQALLLDLDGTLLNGSGFETAVVRTCRDIAARRPGLDQAHLLDANRSVWPDYWREAEDAWTLGRLDGSAVGIEAWRRTLQRCGCEDQALAVWAQERHEAHRTAVTRLFDDVQPLLGALAGRLPLGLVTNGASDTQRSALRALGIEGLFAAVFISGERGLAKPAPAVFERTLGELGVAAEFAWHVGDSLDTDVAGAKAAGLAAVWLNRLGRPRERGGPSPDHEIRSLAELTGLLAG